MSIPTWSSDHYTVAAPVFGAGGTATKTTTAGGRWVMIVQADNLINGLGNNDLQQKLWLQRDSDPDSIVDCDFFIGLSSAYRDTPQFEFEDLNGKTPMLRGRHYSGAVGAYAFFPDLTSGSNVFSLWARSIKYWSFKSPVEILFGCFSNLMLNADTITWLDQTSFQACEELHTNSRFELGVIPSKGAGMGSIAAEAWKCSTDWVTIRPNTTTGNVSMHAISRYRSELRDTVIDLDDHSFPVKSWQAKYRDDLVIRKLAIQYGEPIFYCETTEWDTEEPFPHNRTSGTDTFRSRCDPIDDDDYVYVAELPQVTHRRSLATWWDLAFWRLPQLEIELEMGLLHWNYEVGDRCKVTLSKYDLDEAEFVVTDKRPSFKRKTASMTLLQVHGIGGTPAAAHEHAVDSCEFLYTVNSCGEKLSTHDVEDAERRTADRWIDESPKHTQRQYATAPNDAVMLAGAVSNIPSISNAATRARFPLFADAEFDLGRSSSARDYGTLLNLSGNYYFYFVFLCTKGASLVPWASFGDTTGNYISVGAQPTGTVGYAYDSGSGVLSYRAISPSESYAVWTIAMGHGGGTDGRIGVNGVWQATGMSYSPNSLLVNGHLGSEVRGGSTPNIDFRAAMLFASTTYALLPNIEDGIEEWLMARYSEELA